MRDAHVLRRRDKLKSFPDRVISFDTETHPEGDFQRLTLGWAVYRDKNTVERHFYTSISEFWALVDYKAVSKAQLHILAHNIGFDSMVTAFEDELEKLGYEIREFTIPMPYRLVAVKGRKTVTLLNLANFYGQMSLKKIGKAIGHDKGDPPGGPADSRYWPENGCVPGTQVFEDLKEYCLHDTMIVDEAFQAWHEFCKTHDLGSFAWTLAGQGLEAFKHRFMKHEIFIHDNLQALNLERASYHGGLTDVFRRGSFEGDFVKVDVNSMYPSIMKSTPVPVKMISYRSNPQNIGDIKEALDYGYAMVARVTISYDNYQGLPFCAVVNEEGRLILPRGTFETTLSTPELRRAVDNDMIVALHEYAIYQQEVIFGDYVEYFYSLKNDYKDTNDVFYLISKLFLNTLYGKFAQMTQKWEVSPVRPELQVEDHVSPEGIPYRLRRMGSRSEMSMGEGPGQDTFFAIASHITAYARMKLIDARAVADGDSRHAYYGDTDSLIVDRQGFMNMTSAGLINKTELGFFSVEKESTTTTVTAPKDYKFGHEERHKGIRADAERGSVIDGMFVLDPQGRSFRQVKFEGLLGAMRRGDVNSVRVTQVIKTPTGAYNKGIVEPDGWITPYTLSLDV